MTKLPMCGRLVLRGLVVLTTALTVACSSSGPSLTASAKGTEKPGTELSSSAPASRSSSSSSSLAAKISHYDNSLCSDSAALIDDFNGNSYDFVVTDGDCIGIRNDDALKQTVPLSSLNLTSENQRALVVASSVKLYNNSQNRYNKIFAYAFAITNQSDSLWCQISFNENIYFLDVEGKAVFTLPAIGELAGNLYGTSNQAYNSCLGPGESAVFSDFDTSSMATEGVTDADFARIASATIDPVIAFKAERQGQALPKRDNLLPLALRVETFSDREGPVLIAVFRNNTGGPLRLRDSAHRVMFYDEDGYPVGSNGIRLPFALGLTTAEAAATGAYQIANGEDFTLAGTLDIADLIPATATRARILLEWFPVN